MRILGEHFDSGDHTFTDRDRADVHIMNDPIYQHTQMHINYTIYDGRQDQDTLNPRTRVNIVMFNPREDGDTPIFASNTPGHPADFKSRSGLQKLRRKLSLVGPYLGRRAEVAQEVAREVAHQVGPYIGLNSWCLDPRIITFPCPPHLSCRFIDVPSMFLFLLNYVLGSDICSLQFLYVSASYFNVFLCF